VALKSHIKEFYKQLFGREEVANIHIQDNLWSDEEKISVEENAELVLPFTFEELDKALREMKTILLLDLMAGFSVEFFKAFWYQLRGLVKEMLDGLHQGQLDPRRLNYGVITLFPKVKLASSIK